MNLKFCSLSSVVLWLVIMAIPAQAQEDTTCPELVQTAYETTQTTCDDTGRDEACYGNNLVSAEPQPDITNFEFEVPGDVAEVGEIATLRLSAMDLATEAWGISLIRIQADLPDVSTNYVELLLFGNVEIENRGGSASDAASPYRTMQAFYFTSGTDDRPCDAAPDSGILIQTPEGEGEITVLVNEVVIELGSTAYLQAQSDDDMVINVIEGQGTVTADGVTVVVPAGTRTTVPLDESGVAEGNPTEPQPYDETALATLPLLLLSRQIALAPALPEGDSSPSAGIVPEPGLWSVTETCTTTSTWINTTWGVTVSEWETAVTMTNDTLVIDWPSTVSKAAGVTYGINADGAFTYVETWADEHGVYGITAIVQVLDAQHMQGISTWSLSTEDFPFMECQQQYQLVAGAE